MSHVQRKSRALDNLRNNGNFPRENETWADYMARREAEIEEDRKQARRIFIFVVGLVVLGSAISYLFI